MFGNIQTTSQENRRVPSGKGLSLLSSCILLSGSAVSLTKNGCFPAKVLNAAARVTCLIPKFAHITPVLRELHWLPVKFRVEFKIALLVFKTLNGLAPQYLSQLLVVKPRTGYSLRSDSETLLVIPKVTRKTFGDRAFFHT